jgi:hypothetical protein
MPHDSLISRIEAVARQRRVRPSTVTRLAVDNRRLYERLKAGGDIKLATATRLEDFLSGEEAVHAQTPVSETPAAQDPHQKARA